MVTVLSLVDIPAYCLLCENFQFLDRQARKLSLKLNFLQGYRRMNSIMLGKADVCPLDYFIY